MNNQTNVLEFDIIAAARAYTNRRPGFNTCNYTSRAQYNQDAKPVAAERRAIHAVLDYSTPDGLGDALASENGRLKLEGDKFTYCAGQYHPVEYRAAMLAALGRAYRSLGYNTDKGGMLYHKAKVAGGKACAQILSGGR